MVAAVASVAVLAYLDLRRDQERSFADFSMQQRSLAEVAALAVGPRGDADPPARVGHLLANVGDPDLPRAWLIVDDRGRAWRLDRAGAPLPLDGNALPEDVGALVRQLASVPLATLPAATNGASRISREGAASLGLPARVAVAGYAALADHQGVLAVVTSAKHVRDRARIGVVRLVAATTLAALLAGLVGVISVRQQRRQHALREALRQAEATAVLRRAEKLATIGTLAAGMAHEIGTPLGIISGRAEQVLASLGTPDSTDAAKRGLTSILTQVEKVSTIIRQLLDFARHRPVEARALPPAALLDGLSALLEHRFAQQQLHFAIDVPAGLPPISGDPTQLEQVFVNLLLNAADACAPGGHITARASADHDHVVFSITDDGCGIASEHLEAVLDPFFTTKKRGQGTGLGLSIVADIVKNHRGTLQIDSTVGRGTTVRVRLRIAEGA